MRLIVGLGNPGSKYRDTPHNAGFLVCDTLADRHGLEAETRKFQGLLRRGRIAGEDIAVLKPQTYMNLSGDSVAEALRYLPVSPEGMVLIWDDIDLPQGRIRIRKEGGHGGHNGARSVIDRVGTGGFTRLRVGVGRPAVGRDPTGHLLGRVRPDARDRFRETIELAVEALEVLLARGVDEAMNRYNGRPALGEEPPEGEKEGEGKS